MKTFKQLQLESALSSGLNRGLNEPSKQTKIKIKQHNAAVAGNYPENHPYRLDKAPYGHKFNKSGKIVITNEDYDIESMLEYIEELESALDEAYHTIPVYHKDKSGKDTVAYWNGKAKSKSDARTLAKSHIGKLGGSDITFGK